MDVSIIIVNYNTKELLANCLATVYEKTLNIDFEVIIVDNASSDGSEEFICSCFPLVRWINSGENLGFGRANNLGVRYAQGEYLFLLNSDTLLLNNAIGEFFNYAKEHQLESIGALGCWLFDSELKPNASFGFFPNVVNEIKYLLGRCSLLDNQMIMRERDVDYVIGADLFIKKQVFNSLGGFDPHIFMYYEETDLQRRMAELGLNRRIIPFPRIIHLEGGSFGNKRLTFKRFLMAQHSYNYYLSKHFSGLSYVCNKVMLCLLRLTLFVTTGWSLREKLKAYVVVLKWN